MLDNYLNGKDKIAIVGLGYVGLPLAVAFAEKGLKVIGFDINEDKIDLYKKGIDPTLEVGELRLKRVCMEIEFTNDSSKLSEAQFIIVAVPTPITSDNMPDLRPILGATELIAESMSEGTTVVYESTVYPGATEEECVPALETTSGKQCGVDFKIGYSPERINPGDKVHTLEKIVKVVSGMDTPTLELVASMYELIIEAGVHRASSIKVAEASKIIENTQRDINIAFMNELSKIFNIMNIDTKEVLDAASTKWNFLRFFPGIVGGHCIGVDPFYLANKAKMLGYDANLINCARDINDSMGKFIADNTFELLKKKQIEKPRILVMGFTFKEDCPDLRNTKVADIINELRKKDCEVFIVDPYASNEEAIHEYNIEITDINEVFDVDAIIVAVAHNGYRLLKPEDFKKYYRNSMNILIDVKSIYEKNEMEIEYDYWRL